MGSSAAWWSAASLACFSLVGATGHGAAGASLADVGAARRQIRYRVAIRLSGADRVEAELGGDVRWEPILVGANGSLRARVASAVAMAGYTVTAGRSGVRTSDLLLAGTGAGALATVPAALLEADAWSPAWAVALGLGIGVAMMALGYGLWTRAMAHPAGVRLAPAAYATPQLSTAVLLASGQRLAPLGLAGCALIVLCAGGVVLDAIPPRRHRATAPTR